MKSSRHTLFGRLLRGAAIVLALSGALSAQDWWARFGVQGSFVYPTQSAEGGGPSLGIFWEVPFTDNLYHVVGLQHSSLRNEADLWSLSYDMQYYLLPSWQIGLYGLAGVSYLQFHYSDNKFALNLGAGHYLTRHLALEGKWVLASDDWSYVQLSAKLRF